MDKETITSLLAIGVTIVIFFCGRELWLIGKALENERITDFVKRCARTVFIFVAMRVCATIADACLDLSFNLFAYLVNYGFWFGILVFFRRQRKTIQSEEVGIIGRKRVSASIDEIIDEMKREREKINVTG